MAVGEISNKGKLVYVGNIPNANIPNYWKSFVRKGMLRIEWASGTSIRFEFKTPTQTYDTGYVTTGELDVLLSFTPETIVAWTTASNPLVYFYEIAVPIPETNASGTLTTITTSGTYSVSGLSEVIIVAGGASGGGNGNTTGGVSGGVIYYPGVYLPSSPYPVTIGAGGAQSFGAPNPGGNTTLIGPQYTVNSGGTGSGAAPGGTSTSVNTAFNSVFGGGATTGAGGGGNPAYTPGGGGGGNGLIGQGGSGGQGFGSGGIFKTPFTQYGSNSGTPGTGRGSGGGGGGNGSYSQSGGEGTPGVVYIISVSGAAQT